MPPRVIHGLVVIFALVQTASGGGKEGRNSLFDLLRGDTLRYTVDGSIPDRSSEFVLYGSNSLFVAGTTTFNARLYRPGYLPSNVQSATVYVAGSRYYAYPAGWNLVSLPLTVVNRAKSVIFRSAASSAFRYSTATGYLVEDTLRYGAGYMLRFSGQRTVAISGEQRTVDTIGITTGWNITGSISSAISVTSINQSPPGIIQSSFYAFEGGYFPVDSLKPGRGYWVKASGPGFLILSASPPSLKGGPSYPLVAPDVAAAITVSDLSHAKQTLWLSSHSLDKEESDLFELPPRPPDGVFDARFATNRVLEAVPKGKDRVIPIDVSSEQYPLTMSWQMKGQLSDVSLIIDSDELPITGDGSTTLLERPAVLAVKVGGGSPMPREFTLLQNHPNPFNPSTTIRYALPVFSHVTLKIFNILGAEVRTLVCEYQEPGFHSAVWNSVDDHGEAVGSGVYFTQLQAGSFLSVKKMLLLK